MVIEYVSVVGRIYFCIHSVIVNSKCENIDPSYPA